MKSLKSRVESLERRMTSGPRRRLANFAFRTGFIIVSTLLLSLCLVGQEKDKAKEKWQRLYSLEDVIIEWNMTKATVGSNDVGRVRMRWSWNKAQELKEKPGVKYKIRIETFEFKCDVRQYRLFQTTVFDLKGGAISSDEADPATEWRSVESGGMMERVLSPTCRQIDQKPGSPSMPSTDRSPGRPVLKRRQPYPSLEKVRETQQPLRKTLRPLRLSLSIPCYSCSRALGILCSRKNCAATKVVIESAFSLSKRSWKLQLCLSGTLFSQHEPGLSQVLLSQEYCFLCERDLRYADSQQESARSLANLKLNPRQDQ